MFMIIELAYLKTGWFLFFILSLFSTGQIFLNNLVLLYMFGCFDYLNGEETNVGGRR